MFTLPPRLRKIVYALIFEFLAIIFTTFLLAILSDDDSDHSLPIAIAISVIALIWNYIFNTLFEMVEFKFKIKERTVKVRACHSVLFEVGLCFFTVPLYMWWYDVGVFKAISMEFLILIFFFFYTYVFTWIFDIVVPREPLMQNDKSNL